MCINFYSIQSVYVLIIIKKREFIQKNNDENDDFEFQKEKSKFFFRKKMGETLREKLLEVEVMFDVLNVLS